MKILFLYTQLGVGGAQKVIIDLINNLEKEKFKITLACDGGSRLSNLNSNINIEHINFLDKSPKGIINSISKLYKIVKEDKIEIIHSHHRYTTALANLVFMFDKNIKVIHTEHNVFPDKNFINLRGKNIIAVSNVVRENLIKNRVKEKNIKLIHNGIKVKKESTYKKNNDNIIRIGVIARLSKQKGHIYLLKALKNIINYVDNIKIFMIGDGEEKDTLLKFVTDNKLCEYVEFCGNIDNVLDIIPDFKFFVLPSEYEGLPISILEIMSKKNIVIATDVGGNREIIEDGINGFIIKPFSSNELEKKILEVCRKKELDSLKENAYSTILDKFSLDKMVKSYTEYYQEVGDTV